MKTKAGFERIPKRNPKVLLLNGVKPMIFGRTSIVLHYRPDNEMFREDEEDEEPAELYDAVRSYISVLLLLCVFK